MDSFQHSLLYPASPPLTCCLLLLLQRSGYVTTLLKIFGFTPTQDEVLTSLQVTQAFKVLPNLTPTLRAPLPLDPSSQHKHIPPYRHLPHPTTLVSWQFPKLSDALSYCWLWFKSCLPASPFLEHYSQFFLLGKIPFIFKGPNWYSSFSTASQPDKIRP